MIDNVKVPKKVKIAGAMYEVLEMAKCEHPECTNELSFRILEPEGNQDIVHESEVDKIYY